MMIPHPFQWLSERAQPRAFWLLFALNCIVMFCLQRIGERLVTLPAPNGIVSFELAGNMARANEIGLSWMPAQSLYAGLSLGLDYLFMPLYAASIALGCVLVSQGISTWVGSCGALLAWAQWGAATLDALENYALIQVLLGEQTETWPALARYCAIPKFALVGFGLLFVFIVGLARLFQFLLRMNHTRNEK